MAYITRAASPINGATYDTPEAAIAAFIAPAYAGAPMGEITMTGKNTFTSRGLHYTIEAGDNPRGDRRVARATALKPMRGSRSALDANGKFRGSAWLTREMDREDSDF